MLTDVPQATLPFLLPKTNMIHDLVDQILKLVTLSPGSTNKIRIFEISKDGKYQKEFNSSEMLGNLPETEFFAEVSRDSFDASVADTDGFCLELNRRFRGRNWNRRAMTRLSMSSITRASRLALMVFPSSLSLDLERGSQTPKNGYRSG